MHSPVPLEILVHRGKDDTAPAVINDDFKSQYFRLYIVIQTEKVIQSVWCTGSDSIGDIDGKITIRNGKLSRNAAEIVASDDGVITRLGHFDGARDYS